MNGTALERVLIGALSCVCVCVCAGEEYPIRSDSFFEASEVSLQRLVLLIYLFSMKVLVVCVCVSVLESSVCNCITSFIEEAFLRFV